MKINCLIIGALLIAIHAFGQGKVAQKEVLEDLEYLRTSLEEAHYNLYTYVTKDAFDQNYEEVKASITQDSLSMLEYTSLFQTVISKANNGHTEINFPAPPYINYFYNGGTIFPLEIAFENNKALVRKNWSGNDAIPIGAEIISINDQSLAEVLKNIFPYISAERQYFKLAKLELLSFPRYYWQAYGAVAEFEVEIKRNGEFERHTLQAVGALEDYEMQRYEVSLETRELKFFGQTAYLKPGNFGGDKVKYEWFLDSSFIEIKKKEAPHLIIDLRNNLGGNDSYSDYLVSYIADRPFRWYSEFSLKTSAILKAHTRANYDTTSAYWQSILTHEDGSIYPYEFDAYLPQSADKRYLGEVYVLVNRQSHSQAAVTAAQIQDYNFATLVGEETGEFPSVMASQYSYDLPNTGIEVKISKGYMVRVNGSKKAEGVIPDIYIQDHLLDENDEILEGVLERINKKR